MRNPAERLDERHRELHGERAVDGREDRGRRRQQIFRDVTDSHDRLPANEQQQSEDQRRRWRARSSAAPHHRADATDDRAALRRLRARAASRRIRPRLRSSALACSTSTMTRSDMVTASGIECVTMSTVASRVSLLCQMRISSSLSTSRVSSSRAPNGSSSSKNVGIAHQRAGERRALLHAAR